MIFSFVRRVGLLLLLGMLCVWLQGSFLRVFTGSSLWGTQGLVPNLCLIMGVFLAFYEVSTLGAIITFFIGLELDLFSGVRIGPWAGTLVLLFGLIACFAQRIFVESAFAGILAVFFASLTSSIIYLLFVLDRTPINTMLLWHIFGEAVFTAILAPLFFKILKKILYKREAVTGRMASQFG